MYVAFLYGVMPFLSSGKFSSFSLFFPGILIRFLFHFLLLASIFAYYLFIFLPVCCSVFTLWISLLHYSLFLGCVKVESLFLSPMKCLFGSFSNTPGHFWLCLAPCSYLLLHFQISLKISYIMALYCVSDHVNT